MKTKSMWVAVVVTVVLLASMAGGAGALPRPAAPEAIVAGKINYQGRLTDPTGMPLSGGFPMQFQIYDDPGGGTLYWDSGPMWVNVDKGLFNAELGVDPAAFNGRALWLWINVNGEWLWPRQELVPVPYALSLRPGAQIEGDPPAWDGEVFKVNMTGFWPTGTAVRGTVATGSAISGQATNGGYGLYGYSTNGDGLWVGSNTKTAGTFVTDGGYGIRATANGGTVNDHAGVFSANWGWGVYATSAHNEAVRGEAGDVSVLSRPGGTWGVVGIGEVGGVWGSGGTIAGVYGTSTTQSGVYGETSNDDYTTTGGVYGYHSGNGASVRGVKYGGSGVAVYGTNSGTTGSGVWGLSTNWAGVWAESTNHDGVYARTSRSDHQYGLYSEDYIWALGYTLMGAVMQVVQNGGSEALEPGDVAAFSGVAAPLEEGGPPLVQVSRAASADSTAVAGVVYSRFDIETVTAKRQADGQGSKAGQEVTLDGPVPPGEYLLLVVQGPAQVKASALSGAIQAGDLLSSAEQAGYAAKAAEVSVEGVRMTAPGTVFGKALEPLDAGQKLIYVFVTLQ